VGEKGSEVMGKSRRGGGPNFAKKKKAEKKRILARRGV